MDRNAKLIPLSLDGKAKVLRKLEGTIYFQKTLTKTDVRCKMTVPHWFIKEHGDMIRRSILLRTVSSKQSWTVSLHISITEEKTQVRAVGGWKEFVTFHGLLKGDLLIFSLMEKSKFEVHLYREKAWNTRELHSQPSSRKVDDAKVSRKIAKLPDEHLAAEKRTRDPARSSGSIAKRRAPLGEEHALFDSGRGSSSCKIDLKLHSDKGKCGGGKIPDGRNYDAYAALTAHDIADVRSRRNLKSKCDTRVGPAEQTVSRMEEVDRQQAPSLTKTSQPSFFKKLTVSNICLKNGVLDIPTTFWKTFCKDIHSLVKLQGIWEDSPTRTVTCARHLCAKRYWRLRLISGWRDFTTENKLEENQVLQFTLAGDSFFVVRRVDS